MLDIPSSIQKVIDEFDAIGKSTVGALITERYLSHVQNPSNMAQLGIELNNYNKLVNVITPAILTFAGSGLFPIKRLLQNLNHLRR